MLKVGGGGGGGGSRGVGGYGGGGDKVLGKGCQGILGGMGVEGVGWGWVEGRGMRCWGRGVKGYILWGGVLEGGGVSRDMWR